jgi:hypothetical protein
LQRCFGKTSKLIKLIINNIKMDFGFLEILKVVVIFVCLFLIVISIKLKITEDNINRKEDGLIELFY